MNQFSVLSYNTSFVTNLDTIFAYGASENAFIYAQLKKLYEKDKQGYLSLNEFINNKYWELAQLSCKRIQAFFNQNKKPNMYTVAALQEQNVTKFALENLLNSGEGFEEGTKIQIVMDYVNFGSTKPGLTYVVPNIFELQKKENAVEDNTFHSDCMAIADLGIHPKYAESNFYKTMTFDNEKPMYVPDGGRPLSLIVLKNKNNPNQRFFHFNAQIPNPSAMKLFVSQQDEFKDLSILEQYRAGNTEPMNTWAKITRNVIEEVANQLLGEFGIKDLKVFDVIILSGDLNDPLQKLVGLLSNEGLTLLKSNVTFVFGDMPNSCCANLNSNKITSDMNNPFPSAKSGLLVRKISDIQNTGLDPNEYKEGWDNYQNYLFPGDGSGFCIFKKPNPKVTQEIWDPLPDTNVPSSDHMPVVSRVSINLAGGRRVYTRKGKKKRVTKKKGRRKSLKR